MIYDILNILYNYIIIPYIYALVIYHLYIAFQKIETLEKNLVEQYKIINEFENKNKNNLKEEINNLNIKLIKLEHTIINNSRDYLNDKVNNDLNNTKDFYAIYEKITLLLSEVSKIDKLSIIIDEHKNECENEFNKITSDIHSSNTIFNEKINEIFQNIEDKNNNLYADSIVDDLKYYLLEKIDTLKNENNQ
jgi:hypothetical protein